MVRHHNIEMLSFKSHGSWQIFTVTVSSRPCRIWPIEKLLGCRAIMKEGNGHIQEKDGDARC